MAAIVISLNTETRESVLTINGELVSTDGMWFSKGVDWEGDPFLRFSYTVETKNEDGLSENREFFLRNPADDVVAEVLENGLCCRKTKGLTQAQIDVVNFMSKK